MKFANPHYKSNTFLRDTRHGAENLHEHLAKLNDALFKNVVLGPLLGGKNKGRFMVLAHYPNSYKLKV